MRVSRSLKGLVAGTLLLGFNLASDGANAAVIFDFSQAGTATRPAPGEIGGTVPAPILFAAQLVVTDAAYEQGFSFSQRNGFGVPYAELDGLMSFTTTTLGGKPDGGVLETTVADYVADTDPLRPGWGYRPGSGRYSSLSLRFSRDTGLTGEFRYNTSAFDYRISVTDTRFMGDARSDFAGCFFPPGCAFAGNVTTTRSFGNLDQTVQVPEPASFVLFCTGLLGIGVLAMRRQMRRKYSDDFR